MIVRPTTGFMSLFQQTATEHLRSLESGAITSVELTKAYLDRIAAVDDRVGAFLRVDRRSGARASGRDRCEARPSGNPSAAWPDCRLP